jgi:hypothetical protein
MLGNGEIYVRLGEAKAETEVKPTDESIRPQNPEEKCYHHHHHHHRHNLKSHDLRFVDRESVKLANRLYELRPELVPFSVFHILMTYAPNGGGERTCTGKHNT